MHTELTCAIVRDLLPSYVEGLTSLETNAAVAAHLSSCPDCSALRDRLAEAGRVPAPPGENRQVDYLKKVKRKSWKRAAAAVVCTLIAAAAGLALKLFVIGTPAQEQELTVTQCQETDGVLSLSLSTPLSASAYWDWQTEREGDTVQISARSVLVSPLFSEGGGHLDISLDGVREIDLCGRVIWQDGVSIDRQTWELCNLKTPYVGNAPAVGRIAQALDLQGMSGNTYTVQMHTSSRPYRWTANFSGQYDAVAEQALNRDMLWAGFQLLALVENLDEVSWTYTGPDGASQTRVLTAEDAGSRLETLTQTYNRLNGTSRTALEGIKAYRDTPAGLQQLRDILKCLESGYISDTVILDEGDIPDAPASSAPDGAYHFVS